MFEPDNVRAHLERPNVPRRPVRRLSDELQIRYLAAHWAGSFKAISGAGGLVVLLDLLAMVRRVDWDEAGRSLPGTAVASALCSCSAYLETRGLPGAAASTDALRRSQWASAARNIGLLHR